MKFHGGKSKYKKFIVPILQELINKHEAKKIFILFCGGANIEDELISENTIHSSDNSETLIELLKHVQEGGELPAEVSKELYSDVRSNKNTDKYEKWFIGAVGYLASFNGRYFKGGYARKQSNRDYYDEAKRNLLKQAPKLKNIEFSCKDYREVDIPTGSLIYCDPPYEDTKEYDEAFDHETFWKWAREKSQNNIVVISEEQAPTDFVCIWQQEVKRTMKPAASKKAVEKLFIYNAQY